MQQIKRHSRL